MTIDTTTSHHTYDFLTSGDSNWKSGFGSVFIPDEDGNPIVTMNHNDPDDPSSPAFASTDDICTMRFDVVPCFTFNISNAYFNFVQSVLVQAFIQGEVKGMAETRFNKTEQTIQVLVSEEVAEGMDMEFADMVAHVAEVIQRAVS